MKARWNGQTLAESDDTVVVDGNHYFPANALNQAHFFPSDLKSVCPWKGEASYYDVVVGDEKNESAAWFYPEPKAAAENIKGRIAFWRGVEVVE